MLYSIPTKDQFRLHHPRPRFKREVEDVLMYVSREIVRIGERPKAEFEFELESSIRRFPGNANLALKTIKNWRTEIDALFGLIITASGVSRPSKLCVQLASSGDLISFFRTFLAKFQYPGGHIKPAKVNELLVRGVRFKPAAFLIQLFLQLAKLGDGNAGTLTKAEATYHVWNDLQVTTGRRTPEEVAIKIVEARKVATHYDVDGDKIRYAGDILDYLVLANVLRSHPSGRYRLMLGAMDGANLILSAKEYFRGYDYQAHLAKDIHDLKQIEEDWFIWAGDDIDGLVLNTDPLAMLSQVEMDEEGEQGEANSISSELLQFLRAQMQSGSATTKDIGATGEALVMRHESARLTQLGLADLAKKVKKIPDYLGIGYDIKSWFENESIDKLIEVKTSISHGRLNDFRVHLTKSEWNAATSTGANYWIYRILISSGDVRCFVVQNPVEKYKSNIVQMYVSSGADLTFDESAGVWEELLA